MKRFAFAVAVVILAGCGEATTDSTANESSHTATPSTPPISNKSTKPANSIEELQTAYRVAFNAGDTSAIEQMFHWKDETTEQQKSRARTFLVQQAGTLKVVGISESDGTLTIDFENESTNMQFPWPTVVVDGKYYLSDSPAE